MIEKKLNYSIDVIVPDHLKVIGIMTTKNGCCENRPYLLTSNKASCWPGGINYSCQCSCGMWCTNGHGTPGGAIDEYEEMTRRYEREHKNEI